MFIDISDLSKPVSVTINLGVIEGFNSVLNSSGEITFLLNIFVSQVQCIQPLCFVVTY